MKVYTTLNPEYICNTYLVTDNDNKYGIIIDPGSFSINVYQLVKSAGVEIKKIIVTQNINENTSGIPLIRKIYNANIYAFNEKIEDFKSIKVRDGDEIKEGSIEFNILETPINSYDCISVLSKDTLFIGNIFQAGTLSAFEEKKDPSSYEFQIIKNKILSLPDHLVIYPGKGPATTIEIERKFNPYFKKIMED